MPNFARYAFGGFLLLCFLTCVAPDASAAYGYSDLGYAGSVLSGYSETVREYYDQDFGYCSWWEYDPEYDEDYCAEYDYYEFWVSVGADVFTPSNILAGSGSAWGWYGAEVDFYAAYPGEYGYWAVAGVHYLERDESYQICYSASTCDPWQLWDTSYYFLGLTAAIALVPPQNVSVSLSCSPLNLAIGGTPAAGTDRGTCNATGTPSGGTFSWTVNTDRVSLSGTTGSSVTYSSQYPSVAGGPTALNVTYTLFGVSISGSVGNIWVRQPTSLSVLSDTGTTTVTCNVGGITFNGPHRERQYDARDHLGESLWDAGIATTTVEAFPYKTTCSGGFTLNTGNPNTPRFTDVFQFCHTDNRPGGPTCTMSSNPYQTWSVNGIAVGTYSLTYSQSSISIAP